MTLQNALEGLATESQQESQLAALTEAVGALVSLLDTQQRQALMEQPRDLQYARTVSDAMRVNVENQMAVTLYPGNSASSIQGAVIAPGWFTATATLQVDEREQQRLQSEINFNTVRTGRWSFS